MTLTEIWIAAGPFIASGGVLWGFLKLTPARFLERGFGHYLDRRLAVIKLENDQIIETLKSGLSHLADRGVRSNEREYEALRISWDLFVTAFYATRRAVGGFREIPDLRHMNSEQILRVLEVTKFSDLQKRQIVDDDDPMKAFSRVSAVNEINEAGAALASARDTLRRQSVFIPEEIERRFEKEIAWLQLAHSERATRFGYGGSGIDPKTSTELLSDFGDTVFNEVRAIVRRRLLRSDAVDPFQRPPALPPPRPS